MCKAAGMETTPILLRSYSMCGFTSQLYGNEISNF